MEFNYFPRGGAKETPVINHKKFVFEKKKSIKSKKKKKDENYIKKSKNEDEFIRLPGEIINNSHIHINDQALTTGLQFLGAVKSILEDVIVLNLPVPYVLCGQVSKSSISVSYSELLKSGKPPKPLSSMFFVGQLLSCKVINKPLNRIKGRSLDISVDPKVVNQALSAGSIREGSIVQMAVSSVEDRGYMLDPGIAGVMAFLSRDQALEYSKKVFNVSKSLLVGSLVWGRVTKCQMNSSGSNVVQVILCHDDTNLASLVPHSGQLWPGLLVNTTITKVFPDGCCEVFVDRSNIFGSVNPRIDFNKDPSQSYEAGSSRPATVIYCNPMDNTYLFSFSHFVSQMKLLYSQRAFNYSGLATVDYIDNKFIYLSLKNKEFKSFIPIQVAQKERNMNSADMSSDAEETDFSSGDQVNVQVANVDFFSRKYFCHIVDGPIEDDDEEESYVKEPGGIKKLNGKKIESNNPKKMKYEVGSDTGIDLCSQPDSDLQSDLKVKKKKKKKGKAMIEVSDVNDEDLGSDIQIKSEIDSDWKHNSNLFVEEKSEELGKREKRKKKNSFSEGNDANIDLDDSGLSKKRKNKSENDPSTKSKKIKGNDLPSEGSFSKHYEQINGNSTPAVAEPLSLNHFDSQFLWDATPEDLAKITSKDVDEINEESEEEKIPKKIVSKKQKKDKEFEKERKIREKEEELLKALEQPMSADHYERLILSRPDDSRVWIKYMAFHLEATEIEKARAVGARALKLISHRNEQDRLNMWVALLNLEHLYGSKELFKETWSEALKSNDDYKVNCKVLDLLAGSRNNLEVNKLVQKMSKQYRENVECWYTCLSALMTSGMADKARDLLQRALKSLPPKSHITLVSRFALLENSHDHSEAAQALFDNLLTSYPARVDIWFVYADMLTKSNQLDLTRQVFERASNLKLPAKKMKSIYKKWLNFEENHGSEESIESVRESAMQYVEQASKTICAA